MGRRIIKKDNGLYALWTTVCDDFLLDDVTQEEVVEYMSEQAKEDMIVNIRRQFKHNITIHTDYEERLKRRNELHAEGPDKIGFFGEDED